MDHCHSPTKRLQLEILHSATMITTAYLRTIFFPCRLTEAFLERRNQFLLLAAFESVKVSVHQTCTHLLVLLPLILVVGIATLVPLQYPFQHARIFFVNVANNNKETCEFKNMLKQNGTMYFHCYPCSKENENQSEPTFLKYLSFLFFNSSAHQYWMTCRTTAKQNTQKWKETFTNSNKVSTIRWNSDQQKQILTNETKNFKQSKVRVPNANRFSPMKRNTDQWTG